MKFPVFDLHCDTAFAMLDGAGRTKNTLLQNDLHFDIKRAKAFPAYAQCFACFTSVPDTLHTSLLPDALFMAEYNAIMDSLQMHPANIRQAFTAEDITENSKNRVVSAILTIEGPAGFHYDVTALETLYQKGFRMTTVCWNERNILAGSHATGGGLTDLGKSYVGEAQRLGMLVDVSHISDEAFWDMIQITQGPVVASHSNSRAICNMSRNLTDEMFLAICKTGGVAGINLYREFVGGAGDLNAVCDHVMRFLSMDPLCQHICLGGDLDGCDTLPIGFEGVQDYSKLADALCRCGLCDEYIENIFWNNAVSLFRSAAKLP